MANYTGKRSKEKQPKRRRKGKIPDGGNKISTMYLFRHGPYERSADEFITIAKMIHGDRYGYERLVYRNTKTPVEIVCKKHGPFSVTPEMFIKGQGCPRCRKEAYIPILTIEGFIEEATKRYKYIQFDYSLVELKGLDDPITVICPIHGPFTTTPGKHVYHHGSCPACKESHIWNNKRFLEAARAIHGDKYDYSKTGDITGVLQKVKIICPEHGEFIQSVVHHAVQGSGCPKCGDTGRKIKKTIGFAEFVRRARKIHGTKYTYIESSYTNFSSPLTIICPLHGEFRQTAEKHAALGRGCPKCGGLSRAASRTLPFKDFVRKARAIHKNKYQYVESSYTKCHEELTIICPKHGEFRQTGNSHLSGHGCTKCGYKTVSRKMKARSKKPGTTK